MTSGVLTLGVNATMTMFSILNPLLEQTGTRPPDMDEDLVRTAGIGGIEVRIAAEKEAEVEAVTVTGIKIGPIVGVAEARTVDDTMIDDSLGSISLQAF